MSGGEKSIIGICLILSLSTVIKPPFIILDEADYFIDQNIRSNLTKFIKEFSQKHKIQFFICSFKPEVIDIADNIYEITLNNRESSIRKVDSNHANNILVKLY